MADEEKAIMSIVVEFGKILENKNKELRWAKNDIDKLKEQNEALKHKVEEYESRTMKCEVNTGGENTLEKGSF